MRVGHNHGIISNAAGATVAVNLGADHVAEHEWGINATRAAFGMTDAGYGIERRRARKMPERGRFVSGPAGFWLKRYDSDGPPRASHFSKDGLWTAWSDGDLAALSNDPKKQKRLREVFDAFVAGDGCLWLGGGGVFQNAGLVLGIVSRLDPQVLAAWEKYDRDREKLLADAAATGIEERLKVAERQFFALAPRRAKDGSVVFYLNPHDQDHFNSGEFTVAELDAWIVGKGPVIGGRERRR